MTDILKEQEPERIQLSEGDFADPAKMTPGEIIAEMFVVRNEKAKIKEREKALNEIWRVLEHYLMDLGDKMGMKRMSSDLGTATITTETLPMADDWDAIHQYILESESPHLLQRRISAAAYRELQDAGIDVPGISPYNQRKISLRKT